MIHHKVIAKIQRLANERKYEELSYYIFKEIFKDEKLAHKKEEYMSRIPQTAAKMISFNFKPGITKELAKNNVEGLMYNLKPMILGGNLEY